MKRVCKHLSGTTPPDKYKRLFGRDQLGQEVRDFATAFLALQEARHLAGYDPQSLFLPTDVRGLIDAADFAITIFDEIRPVERTDLLALLMVKARD